MKIFTVGTFKAHSYATDLLALQMQGHGYLFRPLLPEIIVVCGRKG